VIKAFVHEAIAEALKLESALQRLRTDHRIAIIHYAPIRDTIEGEPLEIYPFLGSSRLEEPLSRFDVTAVFHGHAHKGVLEGKTAKGIPVYNVSMPVLQQHNRQYYVLEVRSGESVAQDAPAISERRQTGRRLEDHRSAG